MKRSHYRVLLVSLVGIAILGVLATGPVSAEQTACTDAGMEESDGTWQISNASQLQCIGNESIGASLSDDYELTEDIDASDTENWNDDGSGAKGFDPIGNETHPFNGTFDGSGYEIEDLTITRSATNGVGLFNVTENATVEDVTLENASVEGDDRVSAFAGENKNSTVRDVVLNATVVSEGPGDVGGLAGRQQGGDVVNVSGDVNVTVPGKESQDDVEKRVGGVVGNVTDYETATQVYNPVVTESSVSGNVNISGNVSLTAHSGTVKRGYGGVVGALTNGSVSQSSSSVAVTVRSNITTTLDTGHQYVGGVVGMTTVRSDVTDIESSGEILVFGSNEYDSDRFVGGVVGFVHFSEVTNATATGDVTLDGDIGSGNGVDSVGGIAGKSQGSITESRAENDITGTDIAGGVVGEFLQIETDTGQLTNVSDTIATGDVSGNNSVGGVAGWVYLNTYYFPAKSVDALQNTTATGNVDGGSAVGGVVGTLANTNVSTSTAQGDVNGSEGVGGLVGATTNATVTNSSAESEYVNGTGDYIGGVVGHARGTLITDSNVTDVYVDGKSDVGGLVGNSTTYTDSDSNTWETELVDSDALDMEVNGSDYVGGFVGQNDNGILQNVRATGPVAGDQGVGGTVGKHIGTDATLSDSHSTGEVTGDTYVGGSVGYIRDGSVIDGYATGNVTGAQYVGGFVGANGDPSTGGLIDNATATGTVSVTGDASSPQFVGGLAGTVFGADVTLSTATGDVDAQDAAGVGGLTGYSDTASINQSYVTGNVSGETSVGGLVGGADPADINETYATGSVTGNDYVGGLVGSADGSNTVLARSYAAGNVTGDTSTGGLLGHKEDTDVAVTDAYWDVNTTGWESSDGGTGLTTSELKANTSIRGFDYSNTWETVEAGGDAAADGYPILQGLDRQAQLEAQGIYKKLPSVDSVTRVDSTPTNADSVKYDVTFDESASNVDTKDFTVTQVSGDVSGTVESVGSSSGTTIEVTVGSVSGDGEIRLDVDSSVTYESGETYTIDNTEPTADASNSDTTGDEDTAISFDGSASFDDETSITSYEWDWTDDGTYEGTGETTSHTYADPGTYTVKLRVTDEAGNTNTDTVTVTVESTSSNTDTSSSGSGGGSGGGGGSSSVDETEIKDVETTVSDSDTSEVKAVIDQYDIGDEVKVDFDEMQTGVVGVERVSATFDMGTTVDTEMTVQASENAPQSKPAYEGDTLSYVTVTFDETLADRSTGGEIYISIDDTDEGNTESLSAVHYDDDWETVPVTHVENNTYRVEAPHYSTFALVDEPVEQISDLAVDVPAEAQVGESVSMTATAANAEEYTWRVDGNVVAHDGSVSHTFDTAGEHTVEVTATSESGDTATANTTILVLELEETPGGTPEGTTQSPEQTTEAGSSETTPEQPETSDEPPEHSRTEGENVTDEAKETEGTDRTADSPGTTTAETPGFTPWAALGAFVGIVVWVGVRRGRR